MAHSFTNLLYHVVFATKERHPWLAADIRPHLFSCQTEILREQGGILLAINGVEDHVHILAKLRPDQALSLVLSKLKSQSCGWVHRHRPDLAAFAWQTGYGAFTVSPSQADRVIAYIANQEHHRRVPFDQELRHLLRLHGADAAEEVLWQ